MTLPGLGPAQESFPPLTAPVTLEKKHRGKEYVGSVQLSMGENVIPPQRSPGGWVGDVKKQGPCAQAVAGMGAAHTPALFEEGRGRGTLASGDLGLGCLPSAHPQLCDPLGPSVCLRSLGWHQEPLRPAAPCTLGPRAARPHPSAESSETLLPQKLLLKQVCKDDSVVGLNGMILLYLSKVVGGRCLNTMKSSR